MTDPRLNATVPVERLRHVSKWTRLPQCGALVDRSDGRTLADLFSIKRGHATGCNEYFILSPEQVDELAMPRECLRPILPSPRCLDVNEVFADRSGNLMLYPKPPMNALLRADGELPRAVWRALTSITANMLTGEGRIYGGGLHKIEPKELANVPAGVVLRELPKKYPKPFGRRR